MFVRPRLVLKALFVMLLLPVTSCVRNNVVFHEYRRISGDGWDTCSYINLNYSNKDVSDVDVSIELRATSGYDYANLWLEVSNNINDSTSYEVDTMQVFLVDDKGSRTGTLNAGLYTISTPFRSFYNLQNRNYNIRIRHLMSLSPLKGISDVGVLIEESGKAD